MADVDADVATDEEEEAVEVELCDGSYLLSVFMSPGVTLSVEVERKSDGNRWRGDFTTRYIEEITQRAGNVKSFANFMKMLRSATTRFGCKSLHVDVLTYQDLEMLKEGHASNKENSFSNVVAADKRYLILTYITEFDRVHYPLPLLHEEVSETVVMRRCIQRLRSELATMKTRLRKSNHPQPLDHRAKNISSSDENEHSNFKLLETRALQEKVKGLEEKLRTEGISLKKSITTLLRKNTLLQEEARQARAAERRLSEKLRDSECQIGLLQGRLKMPGLANKSSPFHTRPRTSASPPPGLYRPRPSASPPPSLYRPRTSASPPPSLHRPRISSSSPPNRHIQQRRMDPSASPPTNRYVQYGGSFCPYRSHMSSPRYTNPTPPQFKTAGTTLRSHSCPNLRVRKNTEIDSDEWQARKPIGVVIPPRKRGQSISHEPIILKRSNSNNSCCRVKDDVTTDVGEIDSRLYALRDYLKRINA